MPSPGATPPTPPGRAEPRSGSSTFHLAAAADWDASAGRDTYVPERFASEGFVHCTDGLDALAASGDRHLRSDPRPYVALEIDLDRVGCDVVYETDLPIYPHIVGPVPRAAVVSVRHARRADDGAFIGFGEPDRPPR